MDPMKFSEMSYTRPDIDALLGQCKALAAKAAGAASGEELVNVYYEQSRAFADYSTAAQLASIHYTCDTRDAYWKAEQDFFDANGPAVENARVEISRAFLANAHVDALTEAFGTTCVAGMKNAVLGMDDRTVELQKEYNALVSQYQQVYGGALVELDGKQLTIPQLGPYKENLDPAVRRAAYEAEAAYFDAHRDELDGPEAKEYLIQQVESEVTHETALKIKEVESRMKEECETRAREVVAQAIQRCAADSVAELTVSVVPLPNDEMKGRIIGREGRNIRTIETLTGVDLIIDDTPEAITVSCFEPVRREIARLALEKLIADGRIHPTHIEEMVEKARREVEATINNLGRRL